jgi:two-component system sensor histidine kinase SenX3
VDNAVKYSGQGKKVEVLVAHENGREAAPRPGEPHGSGAGGNVQVIVRDQGVGIPSSEQAHIFDVFYRVEKGLEHDVKGSGLGLAVVKHIVEAHGGTIQLQSRQGQGSTFTIRLPIATEPPRQKQEGA